MERDVDRTADARRTIVRSRPFRFHSYTGKRMLLTIFSIQVWHSDNSTSDTPIAILVYLLLLYAMGNEQSGSAAGAADSLLERVTGK